MSSDFADTKTKKTILIVDDDPLICDIASDILTGAGFLVACVDNGDDAVTIAWDIGSDAVLLDCNLPGKPGMMVLDEFRNSPRFYAMPIAMLTGRRSALAEAVSRDHGADAYIRKPFDPVDLLITVAKLTRAET